MRTHTNHADRIAIASARVNTQMIVWLSADIHACIISHGAGHIAMHSCAPVETATNSQHGPRT